MGTSAVFFDVDFTLIHPGPRFQASGYCETCARHGLTVDATKFEAAVVGAPDREWGEHIIAFVVMRPGTTATAAELDRLCLEQLARFKRPKHYRFVEALPKSGYGKILKTELRRLLPGETPSS